MPLRPHHLWRVIFGLVISILFVFLIAPAKAENAPLRHLIYGGLAWSPDGKYLAVGALDGVWIHDASDLTPISHFSTEFVSALSWRPDTQQLAIGDGNGNVHVWDVAANEIHEVMSGSHDGYGVDMLQWSPDGQQIALVVAGKIVIWNADHGDQPVAIASDLSRDMAFYSISWDPLSRWIITLHHNLLKYDSRTGALNHIWPLNFEGVGAVQKLSPDGK